MVWVVSRILSHQYGNLGILLPFLPIIGKKSEGGGCDERRSEITGNK
jgi:hypothetical protein